MAHTKNKRVVDPRLQPGKYFNTIVHPRYMALHILDTEFPGWREFVDIDEVEIKTYPSFHGQAVLVGKFVEWEKPRSTPPR